MTVGDAAMTRSENLSYIINQFLPSRTVQESLQHFSVVARCVSVTGHSDRHTWHKRQEVAPTPLQHIERRGSVSVEEATL